MQNYWIVELSTRINKELQYMIIATSVCDLKITLL